MVFIKIWVVFLVVVVFYVYLISKIDVYLKIGRKEFKLVR